MGSADFRMIRPFTVSDASLIACSVPEAVVAVYNSGTTYAAGDIRGVTTGTTQLVYKSLQAGNTGNTPASSPLWWQLLGTVYAAYNAGTIYSIGQMVTDLANHDLYESLISGSGHALSDPTKWVYKGKTNRYKQFDKGVYTQSSQPEAITQQIAPGEIVNTLLLLNVAGNSATLEQSVSGYSRTVSLVRHDVLNWYDWYYEIPVRVGDAAFVDIPPVTAGVLTLTVTNPGSDAAIGCCFIGKSRTLGTTQWGLSGNVLSFSTATTDTFANITLTKRNKAKRLNFEVQIKPGFESEAYRILDEYTDVEIAILGAEDYSMTYAYGFLGQWSVSVTDNGKPATVEFKGLT